MNEDTGLLGVILTVGALCFLLGAFITHIRDTFEYPDALCKVIAPATQDYLDCKNKDFNYILKFTNGEYKKVSTNEQQ